jgi:SNF2 family DNA or RNA helicase
MLDRFRESLGFNALILSPVVAGLGLTLVEANHVIHYGRWWNPALEAQATDRVYRIGQTRPVHVYYPIAIDPVREFVTFDEKLARIIDRRRQMAQDFLTPLPGEADIQKELLDEVLAT